MTSLMTLIRGSGKATLDGRKSDAIAAKVTGLARKVTELAAKVTKPRIFILDRVKLSSSRELRGRIGSDRG